MFTVIESQNALSGLITLAEAKRQCRLMSDFDTDDDDLNHIIVSSCEYAQKYTHRLLTPGVIQAESDEEYSEIRLPWYNASTINEVLLDDEAYTDYTFSTTTQLIKIPDSYDNIKINYNAGYAADSLPNGIKHAILMMISTFYNNKDDFIPGLTVQQIPLRSTQLLNGFRDFIV